MKKIRIIGNPRLSIRLRDLEHGDKGYISVDEIRISEPMSMSHKNVAINLYAFVYVEPDEDNVVPVFGTKNGFDIDLSVIDIYSFASISNLEKGEYIEWIFVHVDISSVSNVTSGLVNDTAFNDVSSIDWSSIDKKINLLSLSNGDVSSLKKFIKSKMFSFFRSLSDESLLLYKNNLFLRVKDYLEREKLLRKHLSDDYDAFYLNELDIVSFDKRVGEIKIEFLLLYLKDEEGYTRLPIYEVKELLRNAVLDEDYDYSIKLRDYINNKKWLNLSL